MGDKNEESKDKPKEEVKKKDEPKKKEPVKKDLSVILRSQITWQKGTIIMLAGAAIAALLSVPLQYLNDSVMVKPTMEKTFPAHVPIEVINGLRPVQTSDSLLDFVNVFESDKPAIRIQVRLGNEIIPISNLDWYQTQDTDGYFVGTVIYQFNHLRVRVRYVTEGQRTSILLDATGFDEQKEKINHDVVVYQNGEKKVFHMSHGAEAVFSVPALENESNEVINEIKKMHDDLTSQLRTTFDNIYKLKDHNLPDFYQDMGRAALASVLSVVQYSNDIKFFGVNNGKFSVKQQSAFLQSRIETLEALDAQVFPLMVIAPFAAHDVAKILHTWTNTVNELLEMGNVVENGEIILDQIQQPLLFQLVKLLVKSEKYHPLLKKLFPVLEIIADKTMKNSLGADGLQNVKWLGKSTGLFGNREKTDEDASSIELLCLLEDMNQVMSVVAKTVGESEASYEAKALELRTARALYWNSEEKSYMDLKKKKFTKTGAASYTPLIIGLLADDEKLEALLNSLEADENYLKFGIQVNEESGASLSTNYLLAGALKKYSEQSGTMQSKSHVLYSVLKNNIIATMARSYRSSWYLHGKYDREGKALGPKGSLDGALILPIMAEIFV